MAGFIFFLPIILLRLESLRLDCSSVAWNRSLCSSRNKLMVDSSTSAAVNIPCFCDHETNPMEHTLDDTRTICDITLCGEHYFFCDMQVSSFAWRSGVARALHAWCYAFSIADPPGIFKPCLLCKEFIHYYAQVQSWGDLWFTWIPSVRLDFPFMRRWRRAGHVTLVKTWIPKLPREH